MLLSRYSGTVIESGLIGRPCLTDPFRSNRISSIASLQRVYISLLNRVRSIEIRIDNASSYSALAVACLSASNSPALSRIIPHSQFGPLVPQDQARWTHLDQSPPMPSHCVSGTCCPERIVPRASLVRCATRRRMFAGIGLWRVEFRVDGR